MTLHFRRLHPEEFDAAYRLVLDVHDWQWYSGIRQWHEPIPRESYAARHERGHNYGLLTPHAHLTGVVSLTDRVPSHWQPDLPADIARTWLATLAVHPDYRGQGIGVMLMQQVDAWVSAQGLWPLYLECFYGDFLPTYYQRLGWTWLVRRQFTFDVHVYDGVLMRKMRSSPA